MAIPSVLKSARNLLCLSLLTGLGAPLCFASAVPILFDDLSGISVLVSGSPLPSGFCPGPGESCNGETSVGGTITSSLPLNFNIYEPGSDTIVSDTLSLAQVGDSSVNWTFTSDTGASLTPLPTATSLQETGGLQTLTTVDFTGGNSLVFEFESGEGAAVPEPAYSILIPFLALAAFVVTARRGRATSS